MLWIDNNRGDDGVMVMTMIMIIIIITIIADETDDDDDDNDIYDTYHLVPTVEYPAAYDYVDHLQRIP